MTSIYGGKSNGGSIYGASSSSSSKKSSSGGPMKFIENLGHDVLDMTTGIPTGVVQLATHPVASVEMMGKTTWHDWSPLFKGHVGEFGHNFFEHPLAPILDVAAVVSLGAGSGARLAKALTDAGKVGEASSVARFAEFSRATSRDVMGTGEKSGAPAMTKYYSKNPATKARQIGMEKLSDKLGAQLPNWFGDHVVGERARYANLELKDSFHRKVAMQQQIASMVKAAALISEHHPDAIAEQSKLIEHSYDQLKKFAFRHDATQAIPAGYSVIAGVSDKTKGFSRGRFAAGEQKGQYIGFDREMKRFSRRYTYMPNSKGMLKDGAKPLTVDGGKNVLIVPTHTLKRFEKEGVRSTAFLKAVYHTPTRIWKTAILGYAPRYLVNNAVGNAFMFMMDAGGGGTARALVDAYRQTKKESSVARGIREADHFIKRGWQERYFNDQLNQSLGYSQLSDVVNGGKKVGTGKALTRGGKAKKIAQEGLFPITHKWADQMFRRASLNKQVLRHPEVQKLIKGGMSEDKAVSRFMDEDAKTGGKFRRETSHRINMVMGDYHTMNELETKIRSVVPFYAWDRHIIRHTKHLLDEHAGRANALAKTGQMGSDETKKLLGDVPAFLNGAVPLSMLGLHADSPSRKAILTTQGLNPYATLEGLTQTAKKVTVGGSGSAGESVGSLLNPLLSGGIEQLTGHSLISDAAAKKHGGIVTSVLANTAETLPFVKLAEKLLAGESHPKKNKRTGKRTPFMFKKDARTEALALMGAPIKQLSLERAHVLAKKG